MSLPHPVMLFAAGFGTRMKPLTDTRPKPLIEVAGKPLLDHALDLVRVEGAPRTVVNSHYLGAQIAAHLDGQDIVTSHEDTILDTGGGLRHALPLLSDQTVFTMNTDAVWAGPNPLRMLADHWNPDVMEALLLCLPKLQAIGHKGQGDFVSDHGPATRGPGLVYSGVQILKTQGLAAIEDQVFSLNRLWDDMIARQKLFILPYTGLWCDVGHPAGIQLAEDMLDQHNGSV